MKNLNKISALMVVTLFYVIAIGLAILLVANFSIENELTRVLIADFIATVIIFIFSYSTKNSSVYDPYWSVIPPIIVVYLIWQHPEGNFIRQVIVFVLVTFWSIRLTTNWARGWSGFKQQDWRYTKLNEDTGKFYWLVSFSGIHMFPTLIVFLGCLPLFYIIKNPATLHSLEYIAMAITFLGVVLEWVADEQLHYFKKSAPKGQYMDKGLWSISRHPNYLGEITFWFGLFLFVPAAFSEMNTMLYGSTGFIAMLLLFRFISIPMMDKRNLSKRKGYDEYIKRVPILLPLKIK
ncbi:MAG TPA: hypothetical protein DDY13_15005 [Cytophagales bacterium]|jgi:steroid 5-alpha reductase family enzyme|nr:hypothetical protein [Cytophagales bacterium]